MTLGVDTVLSVYPYVALADLYSLDDTLVLIILVDIYNTGIR